MTYYQDEWSDEERQRLRELRADPQYKYWRDIAAAMNRTVHSVRCQWYRLARLGEEAAAQNESLDAELIPFEKTDDRFTWQERLKIAERLQKMRLADRVMHDGIAFREIDTDRPYAVLHSSDWQMGSLGVDMTLWKRHMEAFLEMDNCGMVVNGDLISNIFAHKTLIPVLSQLLEPREQMLFMRAFLEEMIDKGKLLVINLSEEHDMRDARVTGMSAFEEILRPLSVPMLNNRGTFVLRVGQRYYVWLIVHKSRYKSTMNVFHSPQKEAQLFIAANVVTVAHTHRAGIARDNRQQELFELLEYMDGDLGMDIPFRLGGDVYLVQTGTYEQNSQYGNQFFGKLPSMPLDILVFHPERHMIKMTDNLEGARQLIENGDWA